MSKPLATKVSLPGVMWLVSVTRSQVWMGSRCVKLGVIALTLSYWSLEVQHGTSWLRTLRIWKKRIVALHKDGVGYKKIAKTLKLSCSMVAKTIQRFIRTGFTKNRPQKLVDQRSWVHLFSVISRGCAWEIDVWVLQRLGGSACQCSDHTPHTTLNWSAWLSSQKEVSSKDDAQDRTQTVFWRQADMNYWLVMSSWRRGRGLQWQPVKLWWTPCPRGLRQCWKIMVDTKYWHFGPDLNNFT